MGVPRTMCGGVPSVDRRRCEERRLQLRAAGDEDRQDAPSKASAVHTSRQQCHTSTHKQFHEKFEKFSPRFKFRRSELEPGSSWSVARMRLGQTVCTPDNIGIHASENAITRKQGSESNNFGLASSASDNTDYPSTNARKAYTNDTEQ